MTSIHHSSVTPFAKPSRMGAALTTLCAALVIATPMSSVQAQPYNQYNNESAYGNRYNGYEQPANNARGWVDENRNNINDRDERREERRDARRNTPIEYKTYLTDRTHNAIEEFRASAAALRPGNQIDFYVEAPKDSKSAVVKFRVNNQNRTVSLTRGAQNTWVGNYTIKTGDNFYDDVNFDLTVTSRRNTNSYASLIPSDARYNGNEQDYIGANLLGGSSKGGIEYEPNNRFDNRQPPKSTYPADRVRQSLVGEITNVSTVARPEGAVNLPGAAIGAIAGGILGAQVGKGNGNKAATILGAVGGGYAGNQVGKSMNHNEEPLWIVDVRFKDGSTQRYQYEQNPQVRVGQKVSRDSEQSAQINLMP